MKRLVQKVFDIDPMLMSDPVRLQAFFDEKSSKDWEYCGQVGLFHLFKRWEEEPNIVSGGSSSFRQQPQFTSYGQFNSPSYQPPQPPPTYNSYGQRYGTYNGIYNPNQFGTRVTDDEENGRHSTNPFDE